MNWKLFLLIILSTLLLTACGDPQSDASVQMIAPYIGGNVALEFSLQQGAPPAVVLDGGRSSFGYNIIVNNVGEADIGAGTDNPYVHFSLEAFKPSEFGIAPEDVDDLLQFDFEDQNIMLQGAHKNFDGTIIPGGITSVVFGPLSYQQKLAGGSRTQTLRAKACYDYSNYATVQLCFKDSMIENAADSDICTLTGEKGPQNSGGPLQITSVVQNPLGKYKVHVTFVVEHVGTGDFYGRSTDIDNANAANDDETCNPDVLNMNRNRAYITLWSNSEAINGGSDDLVISCPLLKEGNEGTINMGIAGAQSGASNTELITCTVEIPEDQWDGLPRVFEDTLNYRIDYRYGQYIDQPIQIQSAGQ